MAKNDTVTLIKVAQDKLTETKIRQEKDGKKLEMLIDQRGELLASKIVGDIEKEDVEKIKKLSTEIDTLKVKIMEAGVPLVNALKKKILSLKAQKEKEQKLENEEKQVLIEEKMAKISKEFIPLLKKANAMNIELRGFYASWKSLSEKTGRLIFDRKVSIGSHDMLGIVAGVLISEWNGTSHGKGRQFYNRIDL